MFTHCKANSKQTIVPMNRGVPMRSSFAICLRSGIFDFCFLGSSRKKKRRAREMTPKGLKSVRSYWYSSRMLCSQVDVETQTPCDICCEDTSK